MENSWRIIGYYVLPSVPLIHCYRPIPFPGERLIILKAHLCIV